MWNILMGISVIGALVAAGSAIYTKMTDPKAGTVAIAVAALYVVAVIAGFALKRKSSVS